MARAYTGASDFVTNSPADHSEESVNLFTPQGYVNIFDDEKDASTLLRDLTTSYEQGTLDTWRKRLIEPENFESVTSLFALFHVEIKQRSRLVNLVKTFFLLDNVFKNIILRPYIPAYRSINTDCGRFRSFVVPLKNLVPFEALNFRETSPNLLTYCGTNQVETVRCAHTCAYLHHILKRELDEHDKKTSQQQQQK